MMKMTTDFTAHEQLEEHLEQAGDQFRRGGAHVEDSNAPPQRPVEDTSDVTAWSDDPGLTGLDPELRAMHDIETLLAGLTPYTDAYPRLTPNMRRRLEAHRREVVESQREVDS